MNAADYDVWLIYVLIRCQRVKGKNIYKIIRNTELELRGLKWEDLKLNGKSDSD